MPKFVFLLAAGMVSAAAGVAAHGDDVPPGRGIITAEQLSAVDRGLAWLAARQNENGSWTCKIGYKLNESYQAADGQHPEADHVGATALACVAFMGQGHHPDHGRYGEVVSKAIRFLLGAQRASDGYISVNGSRMYEHAFATMCLAEAYGMVPDEPIREALKRAVGLIVRSQNDKGGWRYQPHPVDDDLSVTVTTLQALRAARNAGIEVPRGVIDRAMAYVKNCGRNPDGSFSYQDLQEMQTRTSFALTAAGVTSLFAAGEYASPEVEGGLRYLSAPGNLPRVEPGRGYPYHFFYGHYYACQALYQAGGPRWESYFRQVREEILRGQEQDGRWEDDVGAAYATAMACIILEIPCEYLPIFQK